MVEIRILGTVIDASPHDTPLPLTVVFIPQSLEMALSLPHTLVELASLIGQLLYGCLGRFASSDI